MRVNDGGHVEFMCNVTYKPVYQYGRLRVQSGIGFIAEKIFRVHNYGPCDSHPFLHTAAQFRRILVFHPVQIDPVKTISHSFPLFCCRPSGKKIEWKTYVFFYCGKIKQCGTLKKHARLLVDDFSRLIVQRAEYYIVIQDPTRIYSMKTRYCF